MINIYNITFRNIQRMTWAKLYNGISPSVSDLPLYHLFFQHPATASEDVYILCDISDNVCCCSITLTEL